MTREATLQSTETNKLMWRYAIVQRRATPMYLESSVIAPLDIPHPSCMAECNDRDAAAQHQHRGSTGIALSPVPMAPTLLTVRATPQEFCGCECARALAIRDGQDV